MLNVTDIYSLTHDVRLFCAIRLYLGVSTRQVRSRIIRINTFLDFNWNLYSGRSSNIQVTQMLGLHWRKKDQDWQIDILRLGGNKENGKKIQ